MPLCFSYFLYAFVCRNKNRLKQREYRIYFHLVCRFYHHPEKYKERVAISSKMLQFKETILRYWTDSKTNIFKNYFDAVFGTIGLIIIPAISFFTILVIDEKSWANYTFPLFSICFAGLYDTYGRYEPDSPKNVKLAIRAIIDMVAFIVTCVLTNVNLIWLSLVPSMLLLLCGLGLSIEAYTQVKYAIEISEWAILGEEDDDSAV